MKVKILHTADNHLDPTFRWLRAKEDERRRDFLQAFHRVVEYASQHKPHIMLISGDLFDKVNPRNPARVYVIKAFRHLYNLGVKIFLIGGNHDTPKSVEQGASPLHEVEASGYARFFSRVGEMEAEHVKVGDLDVCISGASFNHTLSENVDPLTLLKVPVEGDINIAMLHYNLSSFTIPAAWKAPTIMETSIPRNLHYLALGHLHGFKAKRIGGTLAVYPGGTERRTFLEEGEKKGFVWVEIDEEGNQTYKFIEIKARPLKTVKIVLERDVKNPVKRVIETVTSQLSRNPELIVRLRISGTLPLNLLTRYRREEILNVLQNMFFHVTIDDRDLEYLPEKIEALNIELSPLNLYRAYVEKQIEKAKSDEERKILRRALKYGLKALEEAGAW